jgi:hypothetical protein
MSLLLHGYIVEGFSWVGSDVALKYFKYSRVKINCRENAMDIKIAATVMNKLHE